MSQDKQFYQYGYDHYLKPPKKPDPVESFDSPRDFSALGFKSKLNRKLQSPTVAISSLVAAGVLFVGVVFATYPSSEGQQQPIPIIKADLRPIKNAPDDPGGLSVPHRDSTLLAQVGQSRSMPEDPVIKNLLAPPLQDDLVSKEAAIEKAMADNDDNMKFILPRDPESLENVIEPAAGIETTDAGSAINEEPVVLSVQRDDRSIEPIDMPKLSAPVAPTETADTPKAGDILQKVGSSKSDEEGVSSEFELIVAKSALISKPQRPEEFHAAATSPETLDFVRSVLNSEEKKAVAVEPAAGASTASATVSTVAAGSYFVQLASITDAARAGSEFAKMQEKYSALRASKFRVQEASLPGGKFYRIQAGPMSKDSATQICESLKANGKPGGCLVVK